MSLIEYVAAKISHYNQDAQLEGDLLQPAPISTGPPEGQYRLKDLVNPQPIYWSRPPRVAPPNPPELLDAFDFGDRMHARARTVLATFDGFAGSEVDLDGAAVGLHGIRGRVDCRIGESLVEFKTTHHDLRDAVAVWHNAPQDIEQLLFYSTLWTRASDTHRLVFYNPTAIPTVHAFTVRVTNAGALRTALVQRRDALNRAIRDGNPRGLKKCRYATMVCAPKVAGLCQCDGLGEWNTAPLQAASVTERDLPFEAQFQIAWDSAENTHRPISAWDLSVPRRTYRRRTAPVERGDWEPNDGWAYDALLRAGRLPGPVDIVPRLILDGPVPFRCSAIFVRKPYFANGEPRERFVPAIIRMYEGDREPNLRYQHAKLVSLGVACAVAASSEGFFILEKEGDPTWIRAYLVQFRDVTEIRAEVRRRIKDLADALTAGDYSTLPECDEWLQRHPCEGCLCRLTSAAPDPPAPRDDPNPGAS